MTAQREFELDDDGKIRLDLIYNQNDPRHYYQTLGELDYRIPEAAKSIFARSFGSVRETRNKTEVHALDVGCSYGINAALLRHGYGLAELFNLYSESECKNLSHEQLVTRDHSLFRGLGDDQLRITGLDVADAAIRYSLDAGILDDGIVADWETTDPSPAEAAKLASTDIVISTGAVGYVGPATFERILACCDRNPWFAFAALRMFPVDEIIATLKKHGYKTFQFRNQTFRQRQFAGNDERHEVLERLSGLNIRPERRELEGWYLAEAFIAIPADEIDKPPLTNLKPV